MALGLIQSSALSSNEITLQQDGTAFCFKNFVNH